MSFSPLHTFFKLKANTACFSNIKHYVLQVWMKECKAEGRFASLKIERCQAATQITDDAAMFSLTIMWLAPWHGNNSHYYTIIKIKLITAYYVYLIGQKSTQWTRFIHTNRQSCVMNVHMNSVAGDFVWHHCVFSASHVLFYSIRLEDQCPDLKKCQIKDF